MFWVITRLEQPAALELGEHLVGAVGLHSAQPAQARAVELPERDRVRPEGVDVGDLHRVDLLPEPLPGRPKVGNAATAPRCPAPVRATVHSDSRISSASRAA